MRDELSHELRTPLTSIKLAVDLCLRRWDRLDPQAIKEYLASVLKQVEKLETAIAIAEGDEAIEEELDVIVLAEETSPIQVIHGRA